MKYQFTIEKTEQGYRVTRNDFLGYSAVVAPDDLGGTNHKMVEFAHKQVAYCNNWLTT